MRKLLLILIFVLSLANSYSVDFTSCGQAISSDTDYVMTGNLTVSGNTCMDMFDVSNIEFNCGNYIINASDGNLPFDIRSSVDINNITLKNCIFKNISNSPIRIYPGGFDTIENITFENLFLFSSNYYGIYFRSSSSTKINNVYLKNSILETPVFNDVFHDLTSEFFIGGFFMENSSIDVLPSKMFFNNSKLSNSKIGTLFLSGNNNTLENLNLSEIGILISGNNNILNNSKVNQFYLQNQNNTVIGNNFINISEIVITSSPNNLTGNTYYNTTGGASSVCFFAGSVCDNSAIVLPFSVGVIIYAAESVTSLPSFGFWPVAVSVLAVFVGLLI